MKSSSLTTVAGLAAAAAPLRLIVRHRLSLGIAAVRQRHHHFLGGNQILEGEILVRRDDLGAALVGEAVADRLELVADDLEQALGARKNVGEVTDQREQLLVFRNDLLLLEPGQAVQAHVEDGLRLHFRQPIAARDDAERRRLPLGARADAARAREHLRNGARVPDARGERRPGLRGRG